MSRARFPAEVYAFSGEPANSPMGRVIVRSVAHTALGILDHELVLPSWESVYEPMKVAPHGEGSALVFTLFRRPGTREEDFESDAQAGDRERADQLPVLPGASGMTRTRHSPLWSRLRNGIP